MRTATKYPAALNKFCIQLNEFCLMFQEQILLLDKAPGKPPSAQLALDFCESLILCPTVEATRNCIRRDLAGARSFLIAADAVLRRIRSHRFKFSLEDPPYQTRFYVLACAIEEFLRARHEQTPDQPEPICNPT